MKEETTSPKAKQDSIELVEKSTIQDVAKWAGDEQTLKFLEMLVRSGRTGAKTIEEALAIAVQAKELGLGFTCASVHMHVVEGKAGVDIHVIRALLLKAGTGISWKCTEDYVPLYKYKDSNNFEYTDDNKPSNSVACFSAEDAAKAKAEGKIVLLRDANPYDYRTTYEFHREIRLPSGKYVDIMEIGRFSFQKAVSAGLIYNAAGQIKEKSAWSKYTETQCKTRAFTFGGRAIGSDLLLGLYETGELYDINNKVYDVTDDGVAIEVKD